MLVWAILARKMELKEGACVAEKPKISATGLVRPRPELKLLLEKVGATAPVYTKYEVIEHLKEYINNKKLFDPNNPRKIKCEDDDILENVIGCKEFFTENVCELLHHNLESVSDTSDGELGIISLESNKEHNKKRKRSNLTDVSSSSGAGSPLNFLYGGIGFICKGGFESNDDYSDCSRKSSYSKRPGYETPATAVVSDSEDDIVFRNDITDLDTFSVEYEPPETSDEEKDENDSDEEPAIVISSDDDEDPGADGGDEDDNDDNSDSEDSWECAECWAMNHPMTTKCFKCWKERSFALQQFKRTASAPLTSNNVSIPVIPRLRQCKSDFPCVKINSVINVEKQPQLAASPSSAAESLSLLADKKIQVSLSRSSSSCSSTTQTSCDSGVCVSSCETDTERTISIVTDNPDNLDCQKDVICLGDKKEKSSSAFSTYSTLGLPGTSTYLLSSSDLPPDAVPSTLSATKKAVDQPLCVICTTEPRNASIIHGRSGHQVCCITCAEKLKAAKKKCPVCRRRIHYVIKNFL